MSISAQDPRVLVRGLLQFGESSDGAVERDLLAAVDRTAAEIERLTAENERLVAALTEACDIALGTELTRQAVERINELRTAYQQQITKEG